MVKAVIFDLDDTLYPEREYVSSCARAAAVHAAGDDAEKREQYEREMSDIVQASPFGVIDRFCENHEGAAKSELLDVYRAHVPEISLYDDVLPCISELKKRGIKLGLLTDGRPTGQRNKILSLGLSEFFDGIIVTDELDEDLHYRKPDRRAYDMLCAELGVSADDADKVLVVGDNPKKDFVVGKHGYITVRVLRDGLYSNEQYADGVKERFTVDTLDGLQNVIDGLSEKPIRVLQVLSGLNYGGVSAAIMNYYRKIDRTKVSFDFTTTLATGRHEEEIERLGAKIYRLPNKSKHPFKYVRALKKIIKKNGYDIVHSNTNSASAFLDLYAAKRAGCKVRIAHSHNSSCLIKWQHRLFKPLLPTVATERFACSPDAAKWLFGKKKSYKLINNGIDFEKLAFDAQKRNEVRQAMGWENNVVLGNVASFQERKNQRFLIELMPELIKRIPNVTLVLVGNGRMQEQLKSLCGQMGLTERVRFLGARDDVYNLLQGFDVFCFPSVFEGLALAYIEALASSLPTVISHGVPLVDFGNVKQLPLDKALWIEQIQKAAEDSKDRKALSEEEIAGSGYDIKTLASELLCEYKRLTDD